MRRKPLVAVMCLQHPVLTKFNFPYSGKGTMLKASMLSTSRTGHEKQCLFSTHKLCPSYFISGLYWKEVYWAEHRFCVHFLEKYNDSFNWHYLPYKSIFMSHEVISNIHQVQEYYRRSEIFSRNVTITIKIKCHNFLNEFVFHFYKVNFRKK